MQLPSLGEDRLAAVKCGARIDGFSFKNKFVLSKKVGAMINGKYESKSWVKSSTTQTQEESQPTRYENATATSPNMRHNDTPLFLVAKVKLWKEL